ncbi:MAG: hypothetical protein IIC28_03890 [Chloroflexi bacterium]|nr:hypothetical protein [Chloroflexota bacterium]MCI0776201.1 hypothetical protein [Chloroflexota bacterium]MCI0837380.1 hypothetical protein [Chloroflexota bacterium]
MPINDIFGWIILLFLPTYLVWIGFVQIRHKQEWVLVMWSIRHIKKESNPLSPKELGIDSKLFSAKLFFTGHLPVQVGQATESEEGQKLLKSPETRTALLAMTITGWGSVITGVVVLLVILFPAGA